MAELKKQVFLGQESGSELVMPVYAMAGEPGWTHGINVETIHLDRLGDINIPTTKRLNERKLELLLPAQDYPFCTPGATTNPYYYIEQLEKRCDAKEPQRYIVTGTPINAGVMIESVEYSEPDGNGDIVAYVTVKEYQSPMVVTSEVADVLQIGADREESAAPQVSTYTVVKGDSMWAIARNFYGDGSLCYRLAAANGMKNANVLYPGTVLTIPPKEDLPTQGVRATSEKIATQTKPTYQEETKAWAWPSRLAKEGTT